MWKVYGAGFITTIGKKDEDKTFYVNKTEKGSFVTFRIVSRRYIKGENKYESMDCKRFITGDPDNFCNILKKGTMVAVDGTLEQYYNKETKINKYSINCMNVDFCGTSPDNNIEKNGESKGHFD